MKQWAAVLNSTGLVVHAFDADDDLVNNWKTKIVDAEGVTTPPWYTDDVRFIDVSGIDPRPIAGFYNLNGQWVNGNPVLTTDRGSIPADGVTKALVTFTQKGPKAPANVDFVVNGQTVSDSLVNGSATLEVTSTNPGDQISVSVGSKVITITVDG